MMTDCSSRGFDSDGREAIVWEAVADVKDLDPDKTPLVVKVYSKPIFNVDVVSRFGVTELDI